MLAQAAGKIKAFNQVLAWPLVATAEKMRLPAKTPATAARAGRFHAYFTRSRREILAVQRLRYRIFSEEYGASMNAPLGLDRDRFDRHCLHLVVRDMETDEIVGYTRVLPDSRIRRTGGFYSADEFDLTMVSRLPGRVAELGRTCIDARYRSGAVISVLWARLARYMLEEDVRYLIGCASVSFSEGYDVAAIARDIRERHLSDADQRVRPLLPAPLSAEAAEQAARTRMPPLLKAYLRMGARVCGEPCWDPDFNCLDFFILMSVDRLPRRYIQHFMQPVTALATA
jgi:putative hemolysin